MLQVFHMLTRLLHFPQSPRYHSHPYIQEGTQFVVKVHLPVEEGLQRYEGLATDMPSFAHVVGDLGTNVFFDSITLKATNAPINVKVLSDNRIDSVSYVLITLSIVSLCQLRVPRLSLPTTSFAEP